MGMGLPSEFARSWAGKGLGRRREVHWRLYMLRSYVTEVRWDSSRCSREKGTEEREIYFLIRGTQCRFAQERVECAAEWDHLGEWC